MPEFHLQTQLGKGCSITWEILFSLRADLIPGFQIPNFYLTLCSDKYNILFQRRISSQGGGNERASLLICGAFNPWGQNQSTYAVQLRAGEPVSPFFHLLLKCQPFPK